MRIDRIRPVCEEKGRSVRSVAHAIGMLETTLYRQLDSGQVTAATLEKICKELNVSPLEFFDIETARLPAHGASREINAIEKDKTILNLNKIILELTEMIQSQRIC